MATGQIGPTTRKKQSVRCNGSMYGALRILETARYFSDRTKSWSAAEW